MDLNKHIVSDGDDKPFHSSGYAKVANGNRIGSVANTSFSRRRYIDQNRSVIGIYKRSAIGSGYGELRSKRVARPVNNQSVDNKTTLQQHNSAPNQTTPMRFNEPNSRGYNPYA